MFYSNVLQIVALLPALFIVCAHARHAVNAFTTALTATGGHKFPKSAATHCTCCTITVHKLLQHACYKPNLCLQCCFYFCCCSCGFLIFILPLNFAYHKISSNILVVTLLSFHQFTAMVCGENKFGGKRKVSTPEEINSLCCRQGGPLATKA